MLKENQNLQEVFLEMVEKGCFFKTWEFSITVSVGDKILLLSLTLFKKQFSYQGDCIRCCPMNEVKNVSGTLLIWYNAEISIVTGFRIYLNFLKSSSLV